MGTVSLLPVVLALLSGCMQEISRTPGWNDFPGAQQGGATDGTGASSRPLGGAWAIALQRFEGAKRYQEAFRFVGRMAAEADLGDLWYDDNGTVSVVYHGRFRSPRLPDAKAALKKVRATEFDGQRLFAGASFVDVSRVRAANHSEDPHDLRQHAGFYTLQIGYYDHRFGRDFRKAAEDAASVLREEEIEAYYYHGPNLSLLTVGLFTDDDFVFNKGVRVYGPRIRSLQEQFPYHSANGLEVIVTKGQLKDKERSSLVRVR